MLVCGAGNVAVKALLAVLFILMATSANAALCGEYKIIADALEKKYQEVSIAKGVAGQGRLIIELFASPKGSFTILAIETSGHTCVIAAGDGWVIGPSKPKDHET